jgi:hypothetical protein
MADATLLPRPTRDHGVMVGKTAIVVMGIR